MVWSTVSVFRLDSTWHLASTCVFLICFGFAKQRRWDFPDKLWSRFITTHNTYNKGSCNTWIEYGEEALVLEAEFDASRKPGGANAGLTSQNPQYWSRYEAYVLPRSQYFTSGTAYRHAISLMHTLKNHLKIWSFGRRWALAFLFRLHSYVEALTAPFRPSCVVVRLFAF